MIRHSYPRSKAAAPIRLHVLVVIVFAGHNAGAGDRGTLDIERILSTPQEAQSTLVDDLVQAGPQAIRSLDSDARKLYIVYRQARARLRNVPPESVQEPHELDVLERILSTPQDAHSTLVDELVQAGPRAVRSLHTYTRKLYNVLLQARARLMNAPSESVQELDLLLDYDGEQEVRYTVRVMTDILEQGAADADFGRAEVLRALFHIYEVDLRRFPGYKWGSMGSLQDLLFAIVRREIGPDETRVLDEHIHLLLDPDWVSNRGTIDALVYRLIESEHLSPDLYSALHAKMIDTIDISCESLRGQGDKNTPLLTRSAPAQWPCLPHRFFKSFWKSPVGTEPQRDLLFKALVDGVLSGKSPWEWVHTCSLYLAWLRQNRGMPRELVQAYIDRLLVANDTTSKLIKGHIAKIFPDVLDACPNWRSRYTPPKLAEFEWWWRKEGRDATWIPPFEKPHGVRVFLLIQSEEPHEGLGLLTAAAPFKNDDPVVFDCDSDRGPIRFHIQAWPSVREEGITVLSMQTEKWAQDPFLFLRSKTGHARELSKLIHMRNGIYMRIREDFSYRQGQRNLSVMVVVVVDEADKIDALAQTDVDGLFAILEHRWPAGVRLHGGFPDRVDEFLPLRYRMVLARRYLDVTQESVYGPEVRTSDIVRMAKFVCRHGDARGRDALQQWIDKGRGLKSARPALAECDQLLVAAVAAENSAGLLGDLYDPERRDHALQALLTPVVRNNLSAEEKDRLAHLIAGRLLAQEKQDARKFALIVLLRELTNLKFGYDPFAEQAARRHALEQWIEWAGEAP